MKNRHVFLYLLVFICAQACAKGQQSAPPDKQVFAWAESAVQWDAAWYRGPVSCSTGDYNLSEQLRKPHGAFEIEWARQGDIITAIIPELHRILFVQTTREGDLGSIQIRDTCEASLQEYWNIMESRKPVAPVTDPRVQKGLDALQREAARQGTTTPVPPAAKSAVIRSRIEIGPPTMTTITDRRTWSSQKRAALESIVGAAMRDFTSRTEPGDRGHVVIPDFTLSDPAVILLVVSPDGGCVLNVAFERRATTGDPYVAYPTGNCNEDPDAVAYYDKLVSARKIDTRDLVRR